MISTQPVCELVVKLIPSLRASIARELIDSYGMSQAEVAEKLGVSQPAVSQYLRSIRGRQPKILKNKIVENEIKKICQNLIEGKKESGFHICGFCRAIRSGRIICPACKSRVGKDCNECF